MRVQFNQIGEGRKKMVAVITGATGKTAIYMKAPTYAYQIGEFTVERDGTLAFDDTAVAPDEARKVMDALRENGFTCDDQKEPDVLSISYPLEGFPEEAITNLEKMVAAKAPLICKALGVDTLTIEREVDKLTFAWFRPDLTADEIHACGQLVCCLCETAKSKKRVSAREREFPNPKFSMRVFCLGLGMIGSEFAQARRLLMRNLPGNSAWPSGVDPRRKAAGTVDAAPEESDPPVAEVGTEAKEETAGQ